MNTKNLKTGDLIGVAGIESEWGAAIMESSKRHLNSIYDHIGMLEVDENSNVFVWNANPHDGVAKEELQVFIEREENNAERIFDIFRMTISIDFDQVLIKMKELEGLPYNFSFIQSDEAYYCSDLVARTFPENIFPLEPMNFVGDFWNDYYGNQGIEIPHGKMGINPNDMFVQANVEFVENLQDKK